MLIPRLLIRNELCAKLALRVGKVTVVFVLNLGDHTRHELITTSILVNKLYRLNGLLLLLKGGLFNNGMLDRLVACIGVHLILMCFLTGNGGV